MREKQENLNRRTFLGESSCAAVGSIGALSTMLNLKLMSSLSAEEVNPGGAYKALVCVYLAGGNDSFNMLAPVDEVGFDEYSVARGSIGLTVDQFTPLNHAIPDGRSLGIHSEMAELAALFQSGKAAFVANVGTLVEPTDLSAILNQTAKLPLGLYSHSDQEIHWQSSLPDTRTSSSGWGGRMADLLRDLIEDGGVSMNVSLAGTNLFQVGDSTSVFAKNPGDIPGITNWNDPNPAKRNAVQSILEAECENVFKKALAARTRDAIEAGEAYRTALQGIPALASTFDSQNPLSLQLKDVAETIAARENLGKKRQTFFVRVGGWDHHGSLNSHPAMLGALSQAIGEFQVAMSELCVEDQVTLFTASDFGRTLSPNGGGSDHAWGGNQFIVGGAVEGGKVHGIYPELALGNNLDVGRGRMIPTTSVDEYFADLALWMGVSPQNISSVLPNLSRFHSVVDSGAPIGLFGA